MKISPKSSEIASSEIAVELDSVSKSYDRGRVVALNSFSLLIPKGEFVTLTGPSGCGKSTLLHIVGGMDSPDSGRVLVLSAEVNSDSKQDLAGLSDEQLSRYRRKTVGFVFQFFHLLPALKAIDNVSLPLLLDGVSPHDADKMAEDALEKAGIIHRSKHLPGQMSGGEMQRVAIARALVNRPQILVADEPTGNLDSKTSESIIELLKACNRNYGMTLLMATHSQQLAEVGTMRIQIKDGALLTE